MFLPFRLLAKSLKALDGWKRFLDYRKALINQERNLRRVSFLEECCEADIIPRFLIFRITNNGCFEPTVVHNFQAKLLKTELNKAKKSIEKHAKAVADKRIALQSVVPDKLVPSVVLFCRIEVSNTKEELMEKHSNKLQNLSREQERPLFNVHDTVKLVELDEVPPKYVLDTLALGPNNSILDKFNSKEMLAELDILLKKCQSSQVSSQIINDINAATIKYIKACSNQKSPRSLIMTKKYLMEKDLVAVSFDKGIGFCVMKKSKYREKLDKILSLDQFVKEKQPRSNSKDLILKEEERINEALNTLRVSEKISEELYWKLRSKGGQPPRLYGLAKVHKPEVPVRPVLSMPGSPYDNLGTIVTNWLSVIPESQIRCTNKQVVEKIKDVILEEDEVMVSFDVSSLYTNVPVEEAIRDAAEILYAGNVPKPPVDKDTFIKLATLACKDVVMLTHDGYYRQLDGLAMGAKPAPPLANIWLSKFEPMIKDSAKIFDRYMDDIIREINRHKIQEKLREINALHPKLKFTIELEVNGRIAFLDMEISHINNRLSSSWYLKPTDTGLIMNYHALAPKRYKKSVVQSFVHRIHRTCSSWDNVSESLEKAKEILDKNQYPKTFYEPIIKETTDKIRSASQHNGELQPAQPLQTGESPKHNMLIQYRGAVTDQFVRNLHNSNAPVQAIITLRKSRTFVSQLKVQVPLEISSRVIYQIQCPSCGACYVGQTCRHARTRLGEHRTKKKEPVRSHFEPCAGRKAALSDMKILHRTTRSVEFLETLEALYIREISPTLNTKDIVRNGV